MELETYTLYDVFKALAISAQLRQYVYLSEPSRRPLEFYCFCQIYDSKKKV